MTPQDSRSQDSLSGDSQSRRGGDSRSRGSRSGDSRSRDSLSGDSQSRDSGSLDSRSRILAGIRASLGGGEGARLRRAEEAAERIVSHPRGVGVDGSASRSAAVERFAAKAKAASASVEIASPERVGEAIGSWLRDNNLPRRLRVGGDERIASIAWGESGAPELLKGAAESGDLVSLSHARAGVAESGTLILESDESNPATLGFLPENHIVLVEANDILDDYESVWDSLRASAQGGDGAGVEGIADAEGDGSGVGGGDGDGSGADGARVINMVTGPSRSADIEQTLILGAHGPLRLHVVIVSPD